MKPFAIISGLALLLLLWGILLPWSDRSSFTIHMIAHMGIVAGTAPLLALGLSETRFNILASRRWFTPIVASAAELIAVWIWHLPVLRAASEASPAVAAAEQVTFLFAGLALWLSCFGAVVGAGEAGRDERRMAGAVGLLFTSMHMTLLGALLALSPRPLYGEDTVSCFGVVLSAAADQQSGGVIMLLVGAAVYLAGGVSLLAGLLNGATTGSGIGNAAQRSHR